MSKRKLSKPKKKEGWQPFQQGILRDLPGIDPVALAEYEKNTKVFVNNLYQVHVRKVACHISPEGFVWHLSIRAQDRTWRHDWRHLQRIKNEILGPEYEAIELYPAESRLVDAANQYHLWAFSPPYIIPLGFTGRYVSEESECGSKQRPFDDDQKPADLAVMSMEDMSKALVELHKRQANDRNTNNLPTD